VLTSCGASVTVQAVFGEILRDGAAAYKVYVAGERTQVAGATIANDTVTCTIEHNGPLDADLKTRSRRVNAIENSFDSP
jgi:hypothetical protein